MSVIGNEAFSGCSHLETITNYSTKAMVGTYAFAGTAITKPVENLPFLRTGLYANTKISSVDLTKFTNTVIPAKAFYNCPIKNVTVPSNRSLEDGALYSTKLETVTIQGEATANRINYVSNFAWAKSLFLLGNVGVGFARGNGGSSIALTSVIFGSDVKKIGVNAFAQNPSITSVVFEGTRTTLASIGDYAFCGCTGLKQMQLKNVSFKNTSFADCTNLTTVTLTNMGYSGWSFKGNEAITTLYLENCPQVPKEAFRGCYNLEKITSTGTSATTIGDYAFADCTSLNDVYFHDLYAINEGGFRGCTALKDFGSSKFTGIKTVLARAFENCTSLEGYINLSSCTQFGEYIFNNAGTEDLHITIGLIPCLKRTLSGCRAGYLTCNDTRLFNSYTATGNKSPLNGSYFQVLEFPELTDALPTYIFHNMPELQVVKMPKLTDATNLNKNFGFCPALSSLEIVNSKLRYYGGGVYSNDFKTLYYILPSYTSFQAHLSVTKVYADCADQPSWTGGSMSRLGILDLSLCGPVELYNPKGTFNSPSHYVRIPYGKRNDYKTFTAAGMEFITDYIKGDVDEDGKVTIADANAAVNLSLGK